MTVGSYVYPIIPLPLPSPSIDFTLMRMSPGAPWGRHWPAKNIRLIGSLRGGEGRGKREERERRRSWVGR